MFLSRAPITALRYCGIIWSGIRNLHSQPVEANLTDPVGLGPESLHTVAPKEATAVLMPTHVALWDFSRSGSRALKRLHGPRVLIVKASAVSSRSPNAGGRIAGLTPAFAMTTP